MQIYSNTFSFNKPTKSTFYVGPNSDFGIAIKVLSNDVPLTGDIACGDLTAEADKIDGFTVFKTTSDRDSKMYVVSCAQAPGRSFQLQQTVTTSPVFSKDSGGGGGGDLSEYYKKSETSSATQLNTAFGTVNSDLSDASLSIATLDTAVQANTGNIGTISAFTNDVGPILSGDGETTFGLQGDVMNLTGDMAMLTATVNDIQTDMYTIKPAVLADDGMGGYQSKVVVDNNCSADGMGSWTNGITALQQISQSEYDDLVSQMATDPHVLYIVTNSI